MIKSFQTEAAYDAAGYPTSESRVAQIDSTNEVKIDGVNVMVKVPKVGDAVYHDGSRYRFFRGGDALNHSLLVAQGYTRVAEVVGMMGNKPLVINSTSSSAQFLGLWQYSITAISSTSITIGLKMKGDYANYVSVAVTLTSAAINSTTVEEINTALEAAGNSGNVGYSKHGYWAYMADADDNLVTEDANATKIIVQCDISEDYRQYQVTGTGCTIALSVWGDMPASSNVGARINSRVDAQAHLQNIARGAIYYGTNGTTPTENVALNAAAAPVTKTAFETSEYCAALRAEYTTYANYLAKEYKTRLPQKYGVFGLPSGKELAEKYGNMTAPKKNGTTAYKFPALHYPLTVDYNVEGISAGDWFLPGVEEGTMFMDDDTMAAINATAAKTGATQLSNSAYRWFAQRYNVNIAWFFYGHYGILNSSYVLDALTVSAVALLDIDD